MKRKHINDPAVGISRVARTSVASEPTKAAKKAKQELRFKAIALSEEDTFLQALEEARLLTGAWGGIPFADMPKEVQAEVQRCISTLRSDVFF